MSAAASQKHDEASATTTVIKPHQQHAIVILPDRQKTIRECEHVGFDPWCHASHIPQLAFPIYTNGNSGVFWANWGGFSANWGILVFPVAILDQVDLSKLKMHSCSPWGGFVIFMNSTQ